MLVAGGTGRRLRNVFPEEMEAKKCRGDPWRENKGGAVKAGKGKLPRGPLNGLPKWRSFAGNFCRKERL